jgi:hypothetical protein
MRRIRHIWLMGGLGAAMLAAAPRTARSQNSQLLAEVQQLADAAGKRGLPPSAVLNKARVGIQAGFERQKILAVVRDQIDRLGTARDVLGGDAPLPDIEAGAVALSEGIPRSSLEDVRAARPRGSVAVALGVLTELTLQGATVEQATKAITGLMVKQATETQLLAFGDRVRADVSNKMKIQTSIQRHSSWMTAVLSSSASGSAFTLEALAPGDPRNTDLGAGKTPPPPRSCRPPGC